MIFDMQSMFSDKQAITGDAASENTIDLGLPGTPQHGVAPITQDVGRGRGICMRTQVTEDFNNLTSLEFIMQASDDVAFTDPVDVASYTLANDELVPGAVGPLQYLPRGLNKRYVRMFYNVVGTAPTTGRITSGLVFGNSEWSA